MGFYNVNPDKTALLFFDMLKAYYTDLDDAAKLRTAPVVANCALLNSAARAVGIPVVYTQADHRADGLDSAGRYTDTDNGLHPWDDPELRNRPVRMVVGGTWTTEVIDELTPQRGDYVILKHRWSAFHQTQSELSPRTRGIDTIILCGGSTDVGVASTAYAARDLDFDLVVSVHSRLKRSSSQSSGGEDKDTRHHRKIPT